MICRFVRLPVAVLLLLGSAAGAHADFLGQNITAEWRNPNFGASIEAHEFVVDAGIELLADDIDNAATFSIDLTGAIITFEFADVVVWSPQDFNGWWFHDTNGTIPEIVGYSIDHMSQNITGLDNSDLGFDADSVWADFSGVTAAGAGDRIDLKVTFVPEPSSALLLITALALLRRTR